MRKRKSSIFPYYSDKKLIFFMFLLSMFGIAMILSAQMGENAGSTDAILKSGGKQFIIFTISFISMAVFTNLKILEKDIEIYYVIYAIILILLIACRAFPQTNGAYAWIRLGPASFQPSEFAKAFFIGFGAKIIGHKQDNIIKSVTIFARMAIVCILIIIVVQKDTGSALILAGICYLMLLVPPYKEMLKLRYYLFLGIVLFVILTIFILSDLGTNLISYFSNNYMVGRFLAAANPFLNRYDSGYHVIMSLVTFANGGLFGLGYGNSIHKYMNFPNPSTDFILPVIVEETGIVGFLILMFLYFGIFCLLIKYALSIPDVASKMILLGAFAYLAFHFVLNIGGVTGLIPLTGVPLILVSAGGSSAISFYVVIGIVQSVVIKYKRSL